MVLWWGCGYRFQPCPTHSDESWMLDLRVPLHVQRSVGVMVLLWRQASGPAPPIVMSYLLDARVSVGILVFGNPPFRRPSRPHHCLAPSCRSLVLQPGSSPGPPHIPIVAGAGARGRNGLIYRPFMSLQCSLAVFEFICGGRPTGWSWAQMGFECSMPCAALCLRRRHNSSSVCSHGSTGAAACRGALVCGQRAGIHGFVSCHPPTLQVM